MKGIFTISLDFELHWGGFEKWNLKEYDSYFRNTRKVIPQLLAMFAENEVHVTWATVGMLFHRSKQELLANSPTLKPTYTAPEISAYHYIDEHDIGDNETDDLYHYAPSLVQLIKLTPYQEIGSHTFAHYYCNEEGQNVEQFRADIQAAKRVALKYGVELRSLVFPRNQFNDDYLEVCFEEGITSVRSNPRDWFWDIRSTQNESMWKRLNRGMDAYFSIGKQNTYTRTSLMKRKGFPICIPASRLLRPYRPKEMFLNQLKIRRIKQEMERAAKNGEVYHLWWHPHNFGNFPEQNLEGLRSILSHYRLCAARYNMTSMSMGEIANAVL